MRKYCRAWRAVVIALVGGGTLFGCYYDAFTGLWYAYPSYYYPYPYPMAYPYGPSYPYPLPPAQGPYPAQGYAPPAGSPGNAPVQQTPLPPPS
jgi:hypothetical protein